MVNAGSDPGPESAEPRAADAVDLELDVSHLEGAHLLADEAEHRLRAQGYTDDEILELAESHIREEGSGDVDEFVGWVAQQAPHD